METEIRYLDFLEQDLLRAAEFEKAQTPAALAPRRRHVNWLGVAAGLVGLLLVAGIVGGLSQGGSQESRDSGGMAGLPAGEGTMVPGVAPRAGPSSGDQVDQGLLTPTINWQARYGVAHGASSPMGDLTKIIRKGELTVTVPRDGIGKAVDDVTSVADDQGGFVFSSSVGEHAGNLVLRVPASRFDATVTALRQLGTVKEVTVSAQDVTADFVDLTARLRIAKGRFRVLFGLYARATSIEQTLRVQNALDDTQLRIEQIKGQLNVIENQTSQSTIRVSLREQGAPNPLAENVETPSIGGAWDRAIAGFFGVIAAVVIGLGYLIPLAFLALLVWFVVRLGRRRRGASPAP
jgi:uncharacterized protein DUF4349